MWKLYNRFSVPNTRELITLMREMIPKHLVESTQSPLFILHGDMENTRFIWTVFHCLFDEEQNRYYIHVCPTSERAEGDQHVVVFKDFQPIGLLPTDAIGHYMAEL